MRASYFTALLTAFFSLFISCKDFEYSSAFDESYEAFQKYKKDNNNSYEYIVTSSSWTGSSSITAITVLNGQVAYRSYEAKAVLDDGQEKIFAKWHENTSELSTHAEGYEAVTLDRVYERAKSEWLKKRDGVKVYFEAENNGLISSAGYVPDNCQDDCFVGIHITDIRIPKSLHK